MSSSVKKCKSKSKRAPGVRYQALPLGGTLSALAESVRGKLLNTGEYRECRPSELNKLAHDLTDKDRLKTWFEMPDYQQVGGEQQAAPGRASAAGQRRVSVKVFLARPQSEAREHTFTGSVARYDQIQTNFEQFCEYGINSEAALQVGGQYLKWVSSSLVIPKGTKIRDDGAGGGAQPLSIGDEMPIDLGESDKFDQLLELVADYNGRGVFSAISNNSKVFVRKALQTLGKKAPPLLMVFENYQQRITEVRDLLIPDKFGSHRDLDKFFQDRHAIIENNPRNVEFLFFICVCFHVKKGGDMGGACGGRQVCGEQDCCLPYLLSDLAEERLIFNEFWRRFRYD